MRQQTLRCGYHDSPLLTGANFTNAVACQTHPVGDLFAEANQLTFFEQDGVTYRLGVKPLLPGDAC